MEKRENKDGKLVRLAQSGDNDAMEQLCAEYKDTVRMLARPYFLIGADRDDLIQEGMIGLYKAIRDYREDHNASFASFAELCITRQILSAINASRRQKHQPLNSYISLYRTPESGDRELLELIEQRLHPFHLFRCLGAGHPPGVAVGVDQPKLLQGVAARLLLPDAGN